MYGLNLAVPEDARAVIKPWDERDDTAKFADSGVDDQLIIHIPFTQNVRIKSVILKLGETILFYLCRDILLLLG